MKRILFLCLAVVSVASVIADEPDDVDVSDVNWWYDEHPNESSANDDLISDNLDQIIEDKKLKDNTSHSNVNENKINTSFVTNSACLASENCNDDFNISCGCQYNPPCTDSLCKPCCSNYLCDGLWVYSYFAGGESPGVEECYETIGAIYYPKLCPGSFGPFLEVQQHYLNDGTFASNAGVGFRFLNSRATMAFGANVFYDYRNGLFDNFHQFGLGAELLTPCLDFRINGFMPINDGPFFGTPIVFDDYIGDYFVIATREEFSFKGFEAELGKLISFPCNVCLYVGIGPYYLTSKCCESWGAQWRARLDLWTYVFGEVHITYDSIFNDRYRGYVGIEIPLSHFFCCIKDCCCWFNQPIYRQDVIPIKRCCNYKTNF